MSDVPSPESPAQNPSRRRWRPTPFLIASATWNLAAFGVLVAVPGRRLAALAAIILSHLLITAIGLRPRSNQLGPNLVRLPNPQDTSPRVALTFDDGPDPEVTPKVLEMLSQAGARASFFCIGERASQYPEIVASIVAAGHRVENHTYRHPYSFAAFGPRRGGREIDRAQRVLTDLAGAPPHYFRAPAGFRGPFLEGLLAPRGLTLASWTRRGFDTADGDPQRVEARLLRNLAPGDVLLLHDGNAALTPSGNAVCLEVLPRILETLKERGIAALPLPVPAP